MSNRVYINLDTGAVQTDRSFSQNLGDVVNDVRGGIRGRLGEQKNIEVGFCRVGTANTLEMTTPAIDIILKQSTGTQSYDGQQLNTGVTFTEFTEDSANGGTDYFYRGSLDLTQPIFAKLLGVDIAAAKEQVSFQCVADVSESLQYSYLLIYGAGSAVTAIVFYTSGAPEDAPAISGVTATVLISIAPNATAVTVATAIEAAAGSVSGYTATRSTDTVTFTATLAGDRGYHTSGTTGFTMTLLTAGSSPGTVTDIASVDLLAELSWEQSGSIQISELFGFKLCNSLRRDGLTSPGVAGGRVRYADAAIGSGVSFLAVTFATPMPTSAWRFTSLVIINTTDGSPLNLAAHTVTAKSAAGFTVQFNGNTDTANYLLSYVCEY